MSNSAMMTAVDEKIPSPLGVGWGNLLHEINSARIKLSNSNLLFLGGGSTTHKLLHKLLNITCYTSYFPSNSIYFMYVCFLLPIKHVQCPWGNIVL